MAVIGHTATLSIRTSAHSHDQLKGKPMSETIDRLIAALKEIERGCINFRPGHVNYLENRTRAEIAEIARAALALSTKGEIQ